MRLTYLRSPITCGFIALLLSGLILFFGPGPHALAMSQHHTDGHVYVLNNDLGGPNSITVFNREEDGSLSLSGTTSIGGVGSVATFADGTQGSLILTPDRTRLFAVDAGSVPTDEEEFTFSAGGFGNLLRWVIWAYRYNR